MKLQNFIKKDYFLSTLIPVLVVETALIFLYFLVTAFMSSHHVDLLLDQTKTDINELLDKQTTLINTQLSDVSRSLSLLQIDHEQFYQQTQHQLALIPEQENLIKDQQGTYFVTNTGNNCSLYFSPPQPVSKEQLLRVSKNHVLDAGLARIVKDNPLVNQAYLNEQYLNRLCPFIENTPQVFGLHFDISQENFYYLANSDYNPKRNNVWTSAYHDPAGLGWMVTVATPIYDNDTLVAVSGLDITLDTLIDQVLAAELPWGTQAFIIDQDARLLAMPESLKSTFGITTPHHSLVDDHESQQVSVNLLEHSNEQLLNYLNGLMRTLDGVNQELSIGEEHYLLAGSSIPETGWRIVYVTQKNRIFASTNEIKNFSYYIGIAAIVFLITFYILFYFYIKSNSERLADKISDPIQKLTHMTTKLGAAYIPKESLVSSTSAISEIDILSKNFNDMVEKLNVRTQELVAIEAEKIILERMSTTDTLTGLLNRRKCYEVFTQEMQRLIRYDIPFGIILVDIDNFKILNDMYGHAAGDDVLKQCAQVFIREVRNLDYVGRWGGEEFLIICSNISEKNIMNLAERIRQAIETEAFCVDRQVTASFGVSACHEGEAIETVLLRADTALYNVKNAGRNKVACYS